MLNLQLTDKSFWSNDVEAYIFLMKENLDSASDLDTLDTIENQYYPHLKKILTRHKFNGKRGQTYVLTAEKNGKLLHFFFVGVGKLDQAWDRNLEILRRAWASAVQRMKHLSIESAVVALPDQTPFNVSSAEVLKQLVIISHMADYEFIQFKSEQKDKTWNCSIYFGVCDTDFAGYTDILEQGKLIGKTINQARHWIDLPGNIINPKTLSEKAQEIANENNNLSCTIFGEDRARELGMGSFLAVAQGSNIEGKVVVLEYKVNDNAPTIALCGKGVTFDTGGISLKPSSSMDGMKYDMSGAAVVINLLSAIAKLKPNVNIVGIAPLVENMPSGKASRQDDIVIAMNGKTIEIKNTDAEGRLILADAICYAEKFYNPDIIIDIATLTGACAYAVGHFYTALITRDQSLRKEFIRTGKKTGDKFWPLPIDDDIVDANRSDVADISNTGSRSYSAGTITAACFLEAFVSKARWVHLDIASSASDVPGVNYLGKGSTGSSFRSLLEFVMNYDHSTSTKKCSGCC